MIGVHETIDCFSGVDTDFFSWGVGGGGGGNIKVFCQRRLAVVNLLNCLIEKRKVKSPISTS